MEMEDTTRRLRVVRPDETRETDDHTGDDHTGDDDETSTEDYWARVQALRDDLARLRPAN